jgi:hypothetical protein
MSDYPPPPPTQDPGPTDPAAEGYSGRYQPYPSPNPQYGAPYPAQAYRAGGVPPGGGPPAPPSARPGRSGDDFATRLARRPAPRFAAALSGVGAALALVGVLVWGITYYLDGLFRSFDNDTGFGDTNRNLLGAGLAALLVVGGYALAISQRSGPLVTAGVVLAGVGVPLTLAFLTLDATNSSGANLDAVFWVSVVIWAATYAFVRGAKGHTFFVFLVAGGLFDYVLAKNTTNVSSDVVLGNVPAVSGTGTIAAIGLAFGLAYYAIAFVLDRSGRHGPATGLVFTAFVATASGIIAWSPDIHRSGAGVLAVLVGAVVCWYGAAFGRRLTCFAAAAGVAAGITVIVVDVAGDNHGVAVGVSFVLVGVAVIAIAGLVGRALGEPHDMEPEAVTGSR